MQMLLFTHNFYSCNSGHQVAEIVFLFSLLVIIIVLSVPRAINGQFTLFCSSPHGDIFC